MAASSCKPLEQAIHRNVVDALDEREIAETGVDCVATGSLTRDIDAFDLNLLFRID